MEISQDKRLFSISNSYIHWSDIPCLFLLFIHFRTSCAASSLLWGFSRYGVSIPPDLIETSPLHVCMKPSSSLSKSYESSLMYFLGNCLSITAKWEFWQPLLLHMYWVSEIRISHRVIESFIVTAMLLWDLYPLIQNEFRLHQFN